MPSPPWLKDLSRAFRRHRGGRTGWLIQVNRDRLRLVSHELPPRPEEPIDVAPKQRALSLHTSPGPANTAMALSEACAVFDAVMTGTWSWPDAKAAPAHGASEQLEPSTLRRLIDGLQLELVGEQIVQRTWDRLYLPYLNKLVVASEQKKWRSEDELIRAVLIQWPTNSRARQMAHDRYRRLWKQGGWPWPTSAVGLRGNGKAAANPDGVRAFNDDEINELRDRLEHSKRLGPQELLAWDCLIVFGLRPAELKGLELRTSGGSPVAKVTREKRSSRGSSGVREVPAVPPSGWPSNCYSLAERFKKTGLPNHVLQHPSPGEVMAQQLKRLQGAPTGKHELPKELTPYGLRHAFALRLGTELQLSAREAAELMGHSPAVHLSTYGRRLERPKLQAKVAQLVSKRAKAELT